MAEMKHGKKRAKVPNVGWKSVLVRGLFFLLCGFLWCTVTIFLLHLVCVIVFPFVSFSLAMQAGHSGDPKIDQPFQFACIAILAVIFGGLFIRLMTALTKWTQKQYHELIANWIEEGDTIMNKSVDKKKRSLIAGAVAAVVVIGVAGMYFSGAFDKDGPMATPSTPAGVNIIEYEDMDKSGMMNNVNSFRDTAWTQMDANAASAAVESYINGRPDMTSYAGEVRMGLNMDGTFENVGQSLMSKARLDMTVQAADQFGTMVPTGDVDHDHHILYHMNFERAMQESGAYHWHQRTYSGGQMLPDELSVPYIDMYCGNNAVYVTSFDPKQTDKFMKSDMAVDDTFNANIIFDMMKVGVTHASMDIETSKAYTMSTPFGDSYRIEYSQPMSGTFDMMTKVIQLDAVGPDAYEMTVVYTLSGEKESGSLVFTFNTDEHDIVVELPGDDQIAVLPEAPAEGTEDKQQAPADKSDTK